MTSNSRKFLGVTHLAALGLGVMFGLRGSPEAKPDDSLPGAGVVPLSSTHSKPSPELEVGKVPGEFTPISTAEYAAAWDSLKGRFLPRQERLLIEKTLLEEWSVIDLAAAVRAVFAETTDQGPNGFGKVGILSLLDCCTPGIQADPLKAWELIRSRAFGMETGRFRKTWLEFMTETNPVVVFSILGELPKLERLTTLGALAKSYCNAEDPATRAAIWTHLCALPDKPVEQEFLNGVGEAMCFYIPPTEMAARLLGEQTPAGRKICIAALSLALFEVVEKEDFPKLLYLLPSAMRGEVAAAGLKYGDRNEEIALFLANVALDSGSLDALQAVATDPAFARFTKNMEQPLALAEWALRLPEDPRTLEIFCQSIEGAANRDFETVQAKLQALPPNWKRDQGLAVIAKVEKQRHAEEDP